MLHLLKKTGLEEYVVQQHVELNSDILIMVKTCLSSSDGDAFETTNGRAESVFF